ncbi:class I SAM-dependent methyltransferase [Streptomyces uncialis]|uniref:class I SAM-dependent methyltransferase n=1 Tax=Streptomyces uncialis TaxID=1048205 RepID=UPI00093A2E02|nr:class I SAM-dependent methyltransferase [Streptomyces uncialis]
MSKDLDSFDTKATYSDASLDYATAAEEFWGFVSDDTADLIGPRPGQRVLDLCCGPGPMTIRSAERVGAHGYVEAVDILPEMRAITRDRARERGLDQVTVRHGDIDELPPGDASFDVVNCSLGLYFAKDMARSLASFWSYVRPGGTLAVTTIGRRLFEPVLPVFFAACRAEQPGMGTYLPWVRTEDPDVLRALAAEARLTGVHVSTRDTPMPLPSPGAWWPIVHGSGLRRLETELDPGAQDRVRRTCEEWITAHRITQLNVGTVRLIATRGRDGVPYTVPA